MRYILLLLVFAIGCADDDDNCIRTTNSQGQVIITCAYPTGEGNFVDFSEPEEVE